MLKAKFVWKLKSKVSISLVLNIFLSRLSFIFKFIYIKLLLLFLIFEIFFFFIHAWRLSIFIFSYYIFLFLCIACYWTNDFIIIFTSFHHNWITIKMKVLFFSYVSILFEEETRFLFLGEIFAEILST
jgi:hypothetical protein